MLVNSVTGLPALSTGQYFYMTLVDQASVVGNISPPVQREVVKVTAVVGTTLTIVRGLDGTTAQNFIAGDYVQNRINALALFDLANYSALSYTDSLTGAVPRSVQSKFDDIVSVKDFGAKGDGVTDDTTSIQTALTALTSGGTLYFPAGTYVISAALSITNSNVSLVGAGKSTKILTSSATVDVFTVGDGISAINNFTASDFSIDASVAKSAGFAFNVRYGGRTRIDNVFISPPENVLPTPNMKHGIFFNRFDYATVSRCSIIVSGTCIQAQGNNDQSFGAGLFIHGGNKFYTNNVAGSIGLYLGGACGGVYVDGSDFIACENNIVLDSALAGVNNRELFVMGGTSLDSAGYAGILARAASIAFLHVKNVWINNCGVTNSGGPGVLLASPQPAGGFVEFVGCHIGSNAGGGIVDNSWQMTVDGCTIINNGVTTGGHGIYFPAITSNFTLTGNTIMNNGIAATGYGINIIAGCNNYVVVGNNIRQNLQGQLNDAGGPNKQVSANLLT
ncbi:MAG: right-handed parallel beta-helix repeat-containing protein [Patescibacteria group bacterium]|nr:right-handed parallel beta-helix repeat-containing protein [Patescibacteria group bacterium]